MDFTKLSEMGDGERSRRTEWISAMETRVVSIVEEHGWSLEQTQYVGDEVLSRYFDCKRSCQFCDGETITIRISDHYSHGCGVDFNLFDDERHPVDQKLEQLVERLLQPLPQVTGSKLQEALVALSEYDEFWSEEGATLHGDAPELICPRCGSTVPGSDAEWFTDQLRKLSH